VYHWQHAHAIFDYCPANEINCSLGVGSDIPLIKVGNTKPRPAHAFSPGVFDSKIAGGQVIIFLFALSGKINTWGLICPSFCPSQKLNANYNFGFS